MECRVVNAFETWCWRRMLKIKWTDRITSDEVFQRVKQERLRLKHLKYSRLLWIGHIIRHNEFVVNILERAISGEKAVGRPRLQYLKQVARNTGSDSYTAMKRMACNSGVPRNGFWWGGRSTNSVEDRRQRERGSGGRSLLVRGFTHFANE
jgi:hypothetical protein